MLRSERDSNPYAHHVVRTESAFTNNLYDKQAAFNAAKPNYEMEQRAWKYYLEELNRPANNALKKIGQKRFFYYSKPKEPEPVGVHYTTKASYDYSHAYDITQDARPKMFEQFGFDLSRFKRIVMDSPLKQFLPKDEMQKENKELESQPPHFQKKKETGLENGRAQIKKEELEAFKERKENPFGSPERHTRKEPKGSQESLGDFFSGFKAVSSKTLGQNEKHLGKKQVIPEEKIKKFLSENAGNPKRVEEFQTALRRRTEANESMERKEKIKKLIEQENILMSF